MFFWVDDALFPWDFAFYTQGSLPRDERPPPGSYSMEDAELINENRIPINAYSEAFLCHMGISRNYFQSPEEVPTFIGDDGQEMDLFSVRTMELVLEQPEVESTDVLAPTPLRSVPGATVEPPRLDATSVGSLEDADVAGAESEAGEVDSGLKRKRATSDDGAGTSKRVRHVSLGGSTSTEEETPDAPPTLAAKEVTETPPPKVYRRNEEILLLKTQLADAQAEAESSRSYVQKLAEEKMALLVKVEQERGKNGTACQGRARAHEEWRSCWERQEAKLRNSVIGSMMRSFTLTCCPAIAERMCALARGTAEAVEECMKKKLLTVPCRSAHTPPYDGVPVSGGDLYHLKIVKLLGTA
ncbi:hypothetical protein Tco_0572952 [Tanacetum coccineum]